MNEVNHLDVDLKMQPMKAPTRAGTITVYVSPALKRYLIQIKGNTKNINITQATDPKIAIMNRFVDLKNIQVIIKAITNVKDASMYKSLSSGSMPK